jgi:hypothetical protein
MHPRLSPEERATAQVELEAVRRRIFVITAELEGVVEFLTYDDSQALENREDQIWNDLARLCHRRAVLRAMLGIKPPARRWKPKIFGATS